jgi:gliding motility-associated-like protein
MSKDSLCGDELLDLTNTTTNLLDVVTSPFNSLWNLGDGNSTVSTDYSYSYVNLGTYAIKLKVDNIYGCKDSITKIVYVAPKSVVDFTRSDTIICQGESIDFAATATPNYIGTTWDFADGDVKILNKMNVRKAFTAAGIFMVSFKADYKVCTEVEAIHQVEVTPVPNVNIGRDTTICIDNTPLVLKNYSPNLAPLRYLWNTGDTTDQLIIRHPGSYWLVAKDRTCAAADSIIISKGCYIDIPNAFMPGDINPSNAYFIPRDLLSKSAVTFEMKIFNRWGQLIFESNDVHGRGWDGKYKGQDEPMGVYVYQIRVSFANGLNESYSGNVTLLR